MRVVTDAIREGQGEATGFAAILGGALKTTLEAILVLGVNVAYVFKSMGTEIGGMAAQLTALARLDIRGFKAIGEAMREDAAKARAEVDALSARILNPPQAPPAGPVPTTPTAGNTGAATEDMQRMACVLSSGEWRGGRCIKKGAEAKDNSAARLAVLKAQADAEFRLLKTGLDQQKAALDRVRLTLSYRMECHDQLVCEGTSEHCFTNQDGKLLRLNRDLPDFYQALQEAS